MYLNTILVIINYLIKIKFDNTSCVCIIRLWSKAGNLGSV